MKTKLATSSNFKFDVKRHAERGGGKSSTVPDMAPSIKDILANNTVRSQVPVFHSHYPGDVEFPDVSKLDLVEIDNWKEGNELRINDLKERKKKHYERKTELSEKLEQEKFEARSKKAAPPTPPVAPGTDGV